jgi:hypothetical protein
MRLRTTLFSIAAALFIASYAVAGSITGFNGDFSSPGGAQGAGFATSWSGLGAGYYVTANPVPTTSSHPYQETQNGLLYQNLGATTGELAVDGLTYDISFFHNAVRNNVGHSLRLYAVDNTNAAFASAFNGNEILIATASATPADLIPAGTWAQSFGSSTASLPAGTWYLAVQIDNDDPTFFNDMDDVTISDSSIPEPSTLMLMGLGLISAVWMRKRRA